jgi:hypothetical protein
VIAGHCPGKPASDAGFLLVPLRAGNKKPAEAGFFESRKQIS